MAYRFVLLLSLVPMIAAAGPKITVQGHRGAHAQRPENTIASFERAIDAGADLVEIDTWVTKDDIVVVSHDPKPKPSICKAPPEVNKAIRELTLAEVRQWDCGSLRDPDFPEQKTVPGAGVPTFDEVLNLAGRSKKFRFNIEVKTSPKNPQFAPPPDEYAKMILAGIRKHKLEKRVVVQSFDFRILHAMKQIAPDITLAALFSADRREFATVAREAGTRIVAVHYKLATPERVKEAHGAGLKVFAWTANTPDVWDQLIAAGVDSIITDDPDALIRYLKQKGLR